MPPGSLVDTMSADNGVDRAGGGAVQSVDRALALLELIGAAGSAGVTELAAELGVHKSTVSRILGSLEARGFVDQEPTGRKYRVGMTVVRLAGASAGSMDLTRLGQDTCESVAMATGETTNLAILAGDEAINITEATGSSNVALRTWVGQASPAHATSSGKVLLAALDDATLRELLPAELPRFTGATITDRSALEGELRLITERGWATAVEELELGLVAIAAPIRDRTGAVVRALSISGPRYRLEPDRVDELTPIVVDAATKLSTLLGHRG